MIRIIVIHHLEHTYSISDCLLPVQVLLPIQFLIKHSLGDTRRRHSAGSLPHTRAIYSVPGSWLQSYTGKTKESGQRTSHPAQRRTLLQVAVFTSSLIPGPYSVWFSDWLHLKAKHPVSWIVYGCSQSPGSNGVMKSSLLASLYRHVFPLVSHLSH